MAGLKIAELSVAVFPTMMCAVSVACFLLLYQRTDQLF
uniref:Uncharacterized protein n=1 Tax=Anguilla anguilla TaxID=7936 RepID=A0A0E9Q1C0_ANGAN